ncbi:MAG: hypothetical protein ACR5K3_01185 [Wolbachia sp.]
MERLDPSVTHWDDTVCYANYLLIAMLVQLCPNHGQIYEIFNRCCNTKSQW